MNKHFSNIARSVLLLLALTLIPFSLFACATDEGISNESSSETQASPETTEPEASTPEKFESEAEESSSAESTPEESSPEASESETEPETEPETEQPKDPITLKIGSYNIANGLNFKRINSIGKDIKEQDLDIVGLQEVDQFVTRSGSVDSMKLLSESSGLPYYTFFKAIDLQGGEYGVAVLSKYPIVETNKTELESGGQEQRVLGHAVIDVDGILINFFVTHLSAESKALRPPQFATIAEVVAPLDNFIIAGDFNTEIFADYDVIKNADMINNAAYSVNTIPNPNPTISIDNIVFSKGNWTFEKPQVLPNGKSDHCLLYATGTFDPN